MATVTLEAVADTQIREFSPNSNFGESGVVSVGVDSSARRRELIKFDLSSIPSTATIVSATLSLYCLQIPFGSTDPATKIHRSLVEWFEGSGGFTGSTPVPGTNASTWNYRNHMALSRGSRREILVLQKTSTERPFPCRIL